MSDKMREEFEEWFENNAMPLESDWFKRDKDSPDDYFLDHVDWAWEGWKASRAALCVEMPKYYSTDSIGLAYCADAVVDSLDAAGVSYK